MIDSYADFAANERTFLAWLRTGLNIVAFGFVIEKMELFLRRLEALDKGSGDTTATETAIHGLSVCLTALGLVVILSATVQFLSTKRALEDEVAHPFTGSLLPIGVSAVLLAIGTALLLHLLQLL